MKSFETSGSRVATLLAAVIMLLGSLQLQAQTPKEWKQLKGDVTLYMANDLGRNGYYDQKPIAELMGEMAKTTGMECVLAVGDIHHFNGVASVNDPLWMTNFEQVYSHPELMLDWFPVLGNHEYRGNTQAVLDYSKVSRRWMMPARYYTKVFEDNGTTIRIVFLDTTPLIDRYRENSAVYPDACKQDRQAQLLWLDSTLKSAREDWVIIPSMPTPPRPNMSAPTCRRTSCPFCTNIIMWRSTPVDTSITSSTYTCRTMISNMS